MLVSVPRPPLKNTSRTAAKNSVPLHASEALHPTRVARELRHSCPSTVLFSQLPQETIGTEALLAAPRQTTSAQTPSTPSTTSLKEGHGTFRGKEGGADTILNSLHRMSVVPRWQTPLLTKRGVVEETLGFDVILIVRLGTLPSNNHTPP